MSLIIDALKKAQQLQSKGPEGQPFLKVSRLGQEKERQSIKRWSLVGIGLLFISFILLILIKPGPPPLITQSNATNALLEKKSSVLEGGHLSTEPPGDVTILSKDEELPVQPVNQMSSKQSPVDAASRQALNRDGSGQAGEEGLAFTKKRTEEKPSFLSKLPMHKKDAEAPIKQNTEKEKLEPSPSSQNEAPPSKSIEVEQEGRRDRSLLTEILNHFNSGVTSYNQKEFSKAIQAYKKVIELDPTYFEAYNNLGITYQALGETEKASEFYRKSIEINPRYEKGYNNLGILLFLKGHIEEAQEVFEKVLTIHPDNVESHIHLGILFKKKGEWEKAIESYQKALAIKPFLGETHYNLALLYEQLENLDMAMAHYQQFIQLSSKSYPELVSKVQRHLNSLVATRKNKK